MIPLTRHFRLILMFGDWNSRKYWKPFCKQNDQTKKKVFKYTVMLKSRRENWLSVIFTHRFESHLCFLCLVDVNMLQCVRKWFHLLSFALFFYDDDSQLLTVFLFWKIFNKRTRFNMFGHASPPWLSFHSPPSTHNVPQIVAQGISSEPVPAIDSLYSPEFPLEVVRQFVMGAIHEAVEINQVHNRDPIGGSNENWFL